MTSTASDAEPFVAPDFATLLSGAQERTEVRTGDAKSGSRFERVVIDGRPCFFKSLSYDEDWIMRVTGDVDHRQFKVWRAGVYHRFPATVDHTIIGMAVEDAGPHPRLGILMHDVAPWLIPEGDDVVAEATHLGLLTDMARLHAAFAGFRDTIGLTPLTHRFRFFAPDVIAPELRRDDVSPVILAARQGWDLLAERDPGLDRLVASIHAAPGPLADALARTPSTFVPGDWKMGNLGRHADGRTILLDCAYPGEGPGCWDLAWYLALNRARLPMSKEDSIACYRESLEAAGYDTTGWFDVQLELSLVGMIACFGWEKALGDADELAWWSDRATAAARRLS
jgi:hypothetical protein